MRKRKFIAASALVLAISAAAVVSQEATIVIFDKNITAGMNRDEVKEAMGIPAYHEDEIKGLTYKRAFAKLEDADEWAEFVFSEEGILKEARWQLQFTDRQTYSPDAAAKALEVIFFLLKSRYGEPNSADTETGRYGNYDWYSSEELSLSIDYNYWLEGKDPGAEILYTFK